ncbi:MAG: ABC transporter ATP-binding protein [Patescibacteria group bacterium]|jgi:ATP-binding cassette subfamily B protein
MASKAETDLSMKNYSNLQLVKDLFVFLGPYKGRFFLVSILRASGDIAWLFPPFGLANILSFLAAWKPGEPLTHVWVIAGIWISAIIWRYLSHYSAKMMGFRISERATLDAELSVIRQLFRLDTSWHEQENAGNKLKKLERGGVAVDRLVRIWLNNFIEICINFVSIVIILALFDRMIAVGFLGFMITFGFLGFFLVGRASRAAREVNAKEEVLSGLFFEGLNNIRSVKVLGMTEPLSKIISKSATELYDKIRQRISNYQLRGLILGIYANAVRLSGFIFIVNGITRGHFEVGFLLLFNGYFNRVNESLNELTEVSQDFIVAKYGIARMMEILAVPIGSDDETGKVEFPADWKTIAAENLTFSYGGHRVLDRLSFEIKRGERIGVVGLSGAGKSTLFKLLLKENEDYTGKILIDGISLRDIKKSSYYKRAAVVLQETEVFNFSLKENITIAKAEHAKKKEAIKRALDTAHVSDFLDKLPDGVETLIGEKGIKLSGGERQRVGIARAIFKEPEILFMDEATSHLDLESEEKIQDSLHTFFRSVTAVVIAHRLTTIKEMDRILVLEDGELIESGTFDELYKKRGRFHELWEKQKLG